MHPVTKWVLTIMGAALFSLLGIVYSGLAEDIKNNEVKIEKLEEVINKIDTKMQVDEALQQQQVLLLKELLAELKNGNKATN